MYACRHVHMYVHIYIDPQTAATHIKLITGKSILNINLYTNCMVSDQCWYYFYGSEETSMLAKYMQSPMKNKKIHGPNICQGIFAILFHNQGPLLA
jgi:hypothetical protein